ncbi:MAG: hypothetical protein V4598_09050 [Bdellovibrionota bacterium]
MLYLPFILQGLVMVVDEFIIHEKRGLPTWERYGHPLDTLTVLAAFLFVQNFSWTPENHNIYLGLCVFSCLFITKDEFVHQKVSSSLEHWLHSLLFLLHPVSFWCAFIIWRDDPGNPFLRIQSWVLFSFMLYQIIRWSFLWQILTTRFTKLSEKDGTRHGMIRSHSSVQKAK